MEAQGIDHGFAWYRANFRGAATSATLLCRHACDVFLNGELIAALNPPPDGSPVVPKQLPLPARLLRSTNALAVLAENQGRPASWGAAARLHGLVACDIEGASELQWYVKAGLTGEMQEQGFYGFADWDLIDGTGSHAITWHRCQFSISVPKNAEFPLSLHVDQTPTLAYVYLNGQLVGRVWYPRDVRRRVWLPQRLLRNDDNELLIAQWTRGAEPGLGDVRLEPGDLRLWLSEKPSR
jgi:hypothetical protein